VNHFFFEIVSDTSACSMPDTIAYLAVCGEGTHTSQTHYFVVLLHVSFILAMAHLRFSLAHL